MEEYWKPVEGYEGLYEVSNEGRVRSLNYNRTREIRILRPDITKKGYLKVGLCKNGKQKKFLVHRLVAQAFVPNIFSLNEVNHINEVKTDNRVENMMWCDTKENCNWGTRNERISKPVLQFSKDGEFIREWPSVIEVQRVLGFSQGNISMCCLGKLKSAYNYIWKYK